MSLKMATAATMDSLEKWRWDTGKLLFSWTTLGLGHPLERATHPGSEVGYFPLGKDFTDMSKGMPLT